MRRALQAFFHSRLLKILARVGLLVGVAWLMVSSAQANGVTTPGSEAYLNANQILALANQVPPTDGYWYWSSGVAYHATYHYDVICPSGCTENVTRIPSGGYIEGRFRFIDTFSVMLGAGSGYGTATVTVSCTDGQSATIVYLYLGSGSTPAFNNYGNYNVGTKLQPLPANVKGKDCTFRIAASGGAVDFRRTDAHQMAPVPNLTINGQAASKNVSSGSSYTVAWSAAYATACTGSSSLAGASGVSYSRSFRNTVASLTTYTYTVTCSSDWAGNTAASTLYAYVYPAAVVSVMVNGSAGPLTFTTGTSYTVAWSSDNASSCSGSGALSGYTGLSGSFATAPPSSGAYTYSMTCYNAIGSGYTYSVIVYLVDPPSVTISVPGPQTAPASYSVSWTSTGATACTGLGGLAGYTGTSGSRAEAGLAAGTYTYSMQCQNAAGATATDTKTMSVYPPATVTVSVPATAFTAPAGYTASWSSTNAAACAGSNRLAGKTSASGSLAESGLAVGTYTYTMQCWNAAGTPATDAKTVTVYAAPTVDVKVDGLDGPTLYRTGPYSYASAWSSSGTTSCTGASRLSGYNTTSGTKSETSIAAGTTYDYTVVCQNAAGTLVSDTVRMNVIAPPTVDVKIDGTDGPLSALEPADYTITWSSTGATSCTATDELTGAIGTSGTKAYSNIMQGIHKYTASCVNQAGTARSDTASAQVGIQLPIVDLKVDGIDGTATYVSPASFALSWTSQYATTCQSRASDGSWTGSLAVSGSKNMTGVTTGDLDYTVTCMNASGSTDDSVTVVVQSPLAGTISARYGELILMASRLGQPAQSLSGTVSGGVGPHTITVKVRAPSGLETSYSQDDMPPGSGPEGVGWCLDAVETNDPDFGTLEEGEWTAWAEIKDSTGKDFQTNSVTWTVKWYPVHGQP